MHGLDKLARLDLNLLLSFVVLVDTGSVSKAAQHLGLSQSAMSHRLARLRESLGDPLLVATGNELVPTRFALQVAPSIKEELLSMSRALERSMFDPGESERVFRIAGPENIQGQLVPMVAERLRALAPGVTLYCISHYPGLLDDLRHGRLDLALLPTPRNPPAWMCIQEVFCEPMVGLGSRDITGELTLERFLALDHLVVTDHLSGEGPIDTVLSARGLNRRVVLRISSALAAPLVLRRRPGLLWSLTESAAHLFAAEHDLQVFPLPFQTPVLRLSAAWHRRDDSDPAHQWFRRVIEKAHEATQERKHAERNGRAVLGDGEAA